MAQDPITIKDVGDRKKRLADHVQLVAFLDSQGLPKTFTSMNGGAPNYDNGQVQASTAAATLVAARAARRSILIINMDATITVYIGKPTVTAANGIPLKAGASVVLDMTGLVQVISASGTPQVAYLETYD